MSIFDRFRNRFEDKKPTVLTIQEYLEECKTNHGAYASAFERMLNAIGEPVLVDSSTDDRLSRIFSNRKVKVYPAFSDFYGMEDVIENIVSFFKHGAQGLEETKQILYLLGPVGGGKSSLSERLKELMQVCPIYVLAVQDGQKVTPSPLWESPLGLFDAKIDGEALQADFGIPKRYLKPVLSPWAVKRLEEAKGDLSRFRVLKVNPSILNQRGITKVEPGDENNQDISALVGKVNIRKLEEHDQSDPDAYNFVGGLNVTTQGIMEFVEMFKAPIKMLHPLLTATQEGHYNGTEQFGALPFHGIILAHSNESEWQKFRNDKNNEAFLDRVYIVKVPYCLRQTDETKIYQKLVTNSDLHGAPIAPMTLETLAAYSVLTRLKPVENSHLFSKMEVYDGKNLKEKDPKAKSIEEYRDDAGINEGMTGSSTRFAFKVISKIFNQDTDEKAACPIYLFKTLEQRLQQDQMGKDEEERRHNFLKDILIPKYAEFLGDEINKAFIESYGDYGQNVFDKYIMFADAWVDHRELRDEATDELHNREALNIHLEKIEKSASIANPKEFRNEVVGYCLRYAKNHGGSNPPWSSYEKLRVVIEKTIFANTEELLPVISFGKKANAEEEKKHTGFVERMMKLGYTQKQVRVAVEWHTRYKRNN
jgi:serine protein kinase